MKFACLAVALCLVASAVADIDYAGSTVLGTRWNPPTWTVDSTTGAFTCAPSSPAVNTTYQAFNATFTAATYIRILGMFENQFRSFGQVLVYDAAAFTPQANACAGFLFASGSASTGIAIDIPILDPLPGTYTLVVSGNADGAAGLFAVNVLIAQLTGNNRNASGPTWTPPSNSGVSSTCSTQSTAVPYLSYTWTANTTGDYDLEVFVTNATYTGTFYTGVALFQGAFPNATVTGAADPCTNGNFLWGRYDSDFEGRLLKVPLTAGVTYTFVVSGTEADEIGDFGIFIGKSRYGNTSAQTETYLAPTVPARGTTPNCTLGTTSKYYQNIVFQATNQVYIIDTSDGIDAAVFLYEGAFTTAAPTTCDGFLYGGDTGDGGPIAVILTIGRNYTAVVTGYSTADGPFSIFILTGNPLGVPSTTTTGSVTGVTTAATTGSATSAVASMVLVVIAAIFAML